MTDTKFQTAVDNVVTKLNAKVDDLQGALEELKNTYGTLDVDRDRDNNPYGGGWFSKNPAEVQARFGGRWLTTEFQAGDVLVFTMFTLHCSLDNTSQRIRLSTDARYQPAAAPVDERWVEETLGRAS